MSSIMKFFLFCNIFHLNNLIFFIWTILEKSPYYNKKNGLLDVIIYLRNHFWFLFFLNDIIYNEYFVIYVNSFIYYFCLFITSVCLFITSALLLHPPIFMIFILFHSSIHATNICDIHNKILTSYFFLSFEGI